MNQKDNKLPAFYLQFKEQLLTMMIYDDPLAILQSGIFQQYQQTLLQTCPIFKFSEPTYETKIASYQFLEMDQSSYGCSQTTNTTVNYQMIERRSKSANKQQKYCTETSRRSYMDKQRKINMLEEMNKTEFSIWSNILNNCFVPRSKYQQVLQKNRKKYQVFTNLSLFGQDSINNQQNINTINIQSKPLVQSNNKIINNSFPLSQIFQRSYKSCLMNFTPATVKNVLEILHNKIADEIGCISKQTKQLKQTNSKFQKKLQEYSKRQLQFLVKQKDYQKEIEQLKRQLYRLTHKSQNMLQDQQLYYQMQKQNLLQKFRELQKNVHAENKCSDDSNKTVLDIFREKISLDSFRRNMLLGVDRQKWEIQLKRQQLGISRNTERLGDEPEETLDTDHFSSQ